MYPVFGVVGIAGPIFKNTLSIMANLEWPSASGDELSKELKLKKFVFLNDFVVNAYGVLSHIKENVDYIRLDDNPVDPEGVKALIGAGTGLGHGFLACSEGAKYLRAFPSEGGHQDFGPQNDRQWAFYKYLQKCYGKERVCVEWACSGPAITHMFHFFINEEKIESKYTEEDVKNITNKEIIKRGLEKTCNICELILEFFAEIYGQAAGNLSLILLPTGGLYLLGGLSVALCDYLKASPIFRVSYYI
jgi:glucokinase